MIGVLWLRLTRNVMHWHKGISNLFESVVLVGLPLWVMAAIAADNSDVWFAVAMGFAAFAVAMVLGQQMLVRLLARRLRRRADKDGLTDEAAKKAYVYRRLILPGSLTAGVFEETARLAFLTWLLPLAPSPWVTVVAFGLGHGGMEAILVGLGVGVVGVLDALMPTRMSKIELIGLRRQTAQEHWVGIGERIGITIFHVLLTLLVAQTVTGGSMLWFFAAVFLHVAMDYIYAFGKHIRGWSAPRLAIFGWLFAIAAMVVLWISGGLLEVIALML